MEQDRANCVIGPITWTDQLANRAIAIAEKIRAGKQGDTVVVANKAEVALAQKVLYRIGGRRDDRLFKAAPN